MVLFDCRSGGRRSGSGGCGDDGGSGGGESGSDGGVVSESCGCGCGGMSNCFCNSTCTIIHSDAQRAK